MAADNLLSRLDGVRQTGPTTWRARCPAHNSKGLTLAISELDDGRVLAHCFAGCEISKVLAAVGLDIGTLFPTQSPGHHDTKNGKRYGSERRPFPAADVLRCVAYEALIVVMTTVSVLAGEPLSPDDRDRLMLAAARIQAALDAAGLRHGA
jgi:hypothetical protein